MPRYVLGPNFGFIEYPTAPVDTPAKADLYPGVVSAGPEGVVLDYPPFDPEREQAPARTLVYLLPEGHNQPTNAQSWIDSSYPYSQSDAPISPDGEPAYEIPAPTAPPGNYLGQVVLEFAD